THPGWEPGDEGRSVPNSSHRLEHAAPQLTTDRFNGHYAVSNSKQQFATSPDLNSELVNAIISALDAHTAMSTQALNSSDVQRGLKDILLNYAGLYERLRQTRGTCTETTITICVDGGDAIMLSAIESGCVRNSYAETMCTRVQL